MPERRAQAGRHRHADRSGWAGTDQPGGAATVEQLVEAWGEPIRWCIEQFGVDRCMFESNFPVDKASCSYAVLWEAFEVMVAEASAAEHDALFHATASRTYRL